MNKEMLYGIEARKKLKSGVDKLATAVITTLGPRSGNVAMATPWRIPLVVHDGATIAKEIYLHDKFEDIGAQIVKEASIKTNDVAGDGTTTAIVLSQALINEGLKAIDFGANSMAIRKGLEKSCTLIVKEISKLAKKITTKQEKLAIATISAQNEEIGNLISEAMDKVGDGGVITVAESKGFEIDLEYKAGMQFDRGYASPYFVTNNDKMESVIENPYILVTDYPISNLKDILPMTNDLLKTSKDLVIICEEIGGDALAALVVNKLKGMINVNAINAPSFGNNRTEMLQDIAVLTGATFISGSVGRKADTISINDLGSAERVVSNQSITTIVGGKGQLVQDRVDYIKTQIEICTNPNDKNMLSARLAKLTTGVAVINVGAATESELKEKKLRVEDAIQATKAAVEEGIVPGGGITLFHAREALSDLKLFGDEQVGVDIMFKALKTPLETIIRNSGIEDKSVASRITAKSKSNKNIGFDVMSMSYVDMMKKGIIDPAKVTRSALQNAVSAAVMVLTTDCLMVDVDPIQEPKNI